MRHEKVTAGKWARDILTFEASPPPGGAEAVRQFLEQSDVSGERTYLEWALLFARFVIVANKSFAADERRRGRT